MRVPDSERASILRDVNGSTDDCTLVCHIIELLHRGGNMAYCLTRKDASSLAVVFPSSFNIFTASQARQVWALSQRITDVRIHFGKRRIAVHIATAAMATPLAYTPASTRTLSADAVDWHAGGMTDADDVRTCSSIVQDVYNVAARMPDVHFYFDVIGGPDSATVSATDDASTESHVAVVAEGARIGYSLCFAGMPDMSATFFRHLHQAYGTRIADAYAYIGKHVHTPLLVVNVRRATTPSGHATQHIASFVPRQYAKRKRAPE